MTDEHPSIWDQVVVDRSDSISPYRQIANALRHKIATNQIQRATVLPSVRNLATRLGVTPATVARAYRRLQDEGLVESQVGVGTVVADTRHLVYDARRRSREGLDTAIDTALTPLLQIGYAPSEVRDAVDRRLARSAESHFAMVLSDAPPVLEKYLTILRRELAPLGVQVDGALLEAVTTGDAHAIERLRRAGRVLTSLGLLRQVKAALERLKLDPPISIIFTELNLVTIERLSRIPADARTLLVAEERYRTSILGILRQHLPNDQLKVLHELDDRSLRTALAGCDVVVHSLGQSDRVRAHVDGHHQTILMDYQARHDAMAKLRESFLASDTPVPT
jgi:DNA-binding transcriptional regulator YhcF (GntR family)